MIAAHDFAPGNAGLIFYTDIGLPLFGPTPLWARSDSAGGSSLFRDTVAPWRQPMS